jgi:23S rRNA (uracil1939-C5)-methyltransferase
LKIKEDIVRESLQRLGGLADVPLRPVLGMENPWGYRNKGHFQVGEKNGRIFLGFFEESSHALVKQSCHFLFSSGVNALLDFLEEILTRYKVKVAGNNSTGLRHILIRESRGNGEILIIFIYSGNDERDYRDKIKLISQEILHYFPKVVGICKNINPREKGPVLGIVTEVIEGKDWIEDKIGPLTFRISPSSFFQVNNTQAETLYNKAVEYAGLTGEENVVDAYCGVGTISLFLAKKAGKVTGIEIVPEAVRDAGKNAERNGITNAVFVTGEAERIMPEMVKKGERTITKIITDR